MREGSIRLLLGVLLATAVRVAPALALCGDAVVNVPVEQCDVVAANGDAACIGACIPPGVSGACTCALPATSVKQYVAVADERVRLGNSTAILFGGIAVTQPAGSMVLGRDLFMGSTSHAVADRARVAGGADLGRLFANIVSVSPSATLASGGPFRFPPPLVITGLEPFPSFAAGTNDVDVPEGATLALAPGTYGRVSVGDRATLILAGLSPGSGAGTYHLAALRGLGTGSVTAHNPVVLNIVGRLGIGGGGFLGRASFAAALAGDVEVNVGGASARVKQGGTLAAHLRAPRGNIGLGRGAIVTGLLVGKTVSSSGNALLTRQGGCGDGMLEAGEECDTSVGGGDAACPGQCIPGDPQGQGRVAFGQPGQCSCRCTSNADCADANACNGTETCVAGVCTRSLPPSCNDGNPCTRDCDPAAGCVNTPLANGTPCSDDDACTTQDTCQAGTCTGGPARDCDDQNSCTTDSCDPTEGCVRAAVANGTACSDGNACTLTDACLAGVCVGGPAANCFDGNPCTDDTCNTTLGCNHPPVLNGAACVDGNACTEPDSCQNGFCAGPPINCDDANPCTAESCDAQDGCMHTMLPNGTPCGQGRTCVFGSCP